ncbi:MAG: CRTAC1 family protein [Chloroflexota bacterium]
MNYGRLSSIGLPILLLLISGCTPLALQSDSSVSLAILHQAHRASSSSCQDRFFPHFLDHITSIDGPVVRTFDSNGAGLAINDLDRDGDLDLVLANLAGPNAIFWNEGNFEFRKKTFPIGQSRSVSIVDINGDSWQDIVFAHRQTRPQVWMNNGQFTTDADSQEAGDGQIDGFTRLEWFSAPQKAYTMAWADLDGDIDLDFVLATYQTEYTRVDPTDLANGGVVYYENVGDDFVATHLSTFSQALALMLVDLNQDERLDIWVGHDFLMPDQVWLRTDDGWQESVPFKETAQNTMSFAAGDVNNDGGVELFAADMKPFEMTEEVGMAWSSLMETMEDLPTDQQTIANVLQMPMDDGDYENQAEMHGIDATGWSWSAQFGDLDQDGFLDLYVVNGMAAKEMFGHLPNSELIEENLVFRNDGTGHFNPILDWGLNAMAGGRSMNMADLDGDGDLDIVVNNLLSPSVIYENRLCGGNSLTVDLHWPESKNTYAIGAQLVLQTTTGRTMREIRTNSGYLSGDSSQVHLGFPIESRLIFLDILWPDGLRSTLFAPPTEARLFIERQN